MKWIMNPGSAQPQVRADEYGMLLRLQIAAAIGCGFVLLYAVQFWGTWAAIRVAAVGILIAGAALFLGFVLGFIFCIPRTPKPMEGSAPSSSARHNATSGGDIVARSNVVRPSEVETNSNLVDISDWITKILVGVGLVELNKIPGYLHKLAIFLGAGLRADGPVRLCPAARLLHWELCSTLLP